MDRRTPAVPRRSHIWAKESSGWYVEPSWCSKRLFEVEKFAAMILDPACGAGVIVNEAKVAGYKARGSDIADRRSMCGFKFQFDRRDFLKPEMPLLVHTSIVCNPPFDHVEDFCRTGLALGAEKVAMICLTRRLNAAAWLRDLPLQSVYLLTPRPSMPPGSWIAAGNHPGGGTQDFCWLVFQKGHRGAPRLKWLHRDGDGSK